MCDVAEHLEKRGYNEDVSEGMKHIYSLIHKGKLLPSVVAEEFGMTVQAVETEYYRLYPIPLDFGLETVVAKQAEEKNVPYPHAYIMGFIESYTMESCLTLVRCIKLGVSESQIKEMLNVSDKTISEFQQALSCSQNTKQEDTKPTVEQEILFSAIDRELAKQTVVSESMRHMIVARFVDSFDFSNSAAKHKSPAGWAKYLLDKYHLEPNQEYWEGNGNDE